MKRRTFLALGAGAVYGLVGRPFARPLAAADGPLPFKISLAEWSLNKTLRAKKMTNLDFPVVAKREFGIDCVEYVDQFFRDKATDKSYLRELRSRCEGEGVESGLIMIDTTGQLGHPYATRRDDAVEKTFAWIDAAKYLGCHTVRVNAYGGGTPEELQFRVAESCSRLADHAAERGINIAIENHGGPSSDPVWLTTVMKTVNKPNFGTLPDFGNFPGSVDRYEAVDLMMPFAKAVSAKASRFTPEGLCRETDYFRMMRIVRDHGYTGHVGVESGARSQEGEAEAIRLTRDLLQRVREQQQRCRPIFNGQDLRGWVQIGGGTWVVADGVLVGSNGRGWAVDPENAGSWLRSSEEYRDFRLELQYDISEKGNSGVFFRAAKERNPAYTGYEFQIYDAPGREPSKGGPSSLYDLVAPTKNVVKPHGEWNSVTIVARGSRIEIEVNGVPVMDTRQDRSLKGHVGLQIHDERSRVRFRNIRVERL